MPTSSNSSGLYRFGTSPLLRMLLMSSRKDSSKAWVSLNRNTVGLFSTPVRKYRRFKSNETKSSLKLTMIGGKGKVYAYEPNGPSGRSFFPVFVE